VAAVQPDRALFSSDFRAPERLFALLMQAAGRAGRDAPMWPRREPPEMWLQTWHPDHALYAALRRHDYPAFAAQQLAERAAPACRPCPPGPGARRRAQPGDAQAFLQAAAEAARTAALPGLEQVFMFPPVPLAVQRVAGVERRRCC
jgi:primosomal protein N' (replication factor Y)